MACKSGPLISPHMFRRFMLEPYKRLTGFIRDHGIDLIFVDSDGNICGEYSNFLHAGSLQGDIR